jgi:signal transduction histidine kinase
VAALANAVRSALRARDRQYRARAYLLERDRAARALEEADRRKDEFLATLAHELRNPLAPIRNSAYILRLTAASDPSAYLYEIMQRQVDYMVRLVDDLLEVSRITRGKIELRKERVDLSAIIQAAVETTRPHIESARHELTIALTPEPLFLEADTVRLVRNRPHPGAHPRRDARRQRKRSQCRSRKRQRVCGAATVVSGSARFATLPHADRLCRGSRSDAGPGG